MSNKLQRDAFRRRVGYGVAIFALFGLSMFWRGKLEVPLAKSLAAPRWLNERSVLAQSEKLELRELDQGNPEIAGETARLAFVGARGVVVTALWTAAIRKQARNEFDQFEILARAVTTLQPHFVTPWIYQGWNIAYNVSVENDKLGDMYFYIAHGIELLAEGDSRNSKVYRAADGTTRKVGSPDMRYHIGFFYQNKFSVSDKVSTLRSLMQLSCIKPTDRARSRLETTAGGERRVDEPAFRRFCQDNPQLVRRLRAKLGCDRPADVVQFLADNEKIPALFTPEGELRSASEQFPIFPERFEEAPGEFTAGSEVGDGFDAFHAARAWFLYSLTVIPPAKTDRGGDPLPWRSPKPGEYDASRYRMPRSPSLVIFRQQAPRAQTYLATRLAEEGWFDDTSAWEPDEAAGASSRWFAPDPSGEPVRLRAADSSRLQWQRAFNMWDEHGERNAMKLSDARRAALLAAAQPESTGGARQVPPTQLLPEVTEAELAAYGLTKDRVEANNALIYFESGRSVTNFAYFWESANAEQADATVQARKLFWDAEQARAGGRNNRAAGLYRAALAQWRQVLAAHPGFHRPPNSDATEEATCEYELKLQGLLREDGAVRDRARRAADAAAAVMGPLAQARTPDDYLQAAAEDEAGLQVAAESLRSVFPRLPLTPDDPRAQALRRAADTLAASGALGGAFAAPEVAGGAVGRGVIEAAYPWLREFKYPPVTRDDAGLYERSAYWVRPEVRDGVRDRLGLRRKPSAPAAAPAAGAAEALPADPR